jgi:hypothetical protein
MRRRRERPLSDGGTPRKKTRASTPAKHRSRSRGRAVELVPSPASKDQGGPARTPPRPSTPRPRAASPAPHSSRPTRKAATTAAEWGNAVRRREEGDKNGAGHTQLPGWDGAAPIDMAFDAVAATIVCIGIAAGESVLILSASILVSLLVLALKRSARGARVPEPEWILSVAPPRSFLPQEQHGKNDPPLPSPQHAQRMRPRTCFAAPHLLPLPRPQPHHAPLPRSPQTRQSWCATAPGRTWSRSRASPARSAPKSPRRSRQARRWGRNPLPPPSRTNWTRLVLPPVLTGHVSAASTSRTGSASLWPSAYGTTASSGAPPDARPSFYKKPF